MTKKLPRKSPAKNIASSTADKPSRPSITIMIEDYLKFKGDYQFAERVLDFIPEPISIKNSKGEYLVFNKTMEEVGGYRRDDAVGKSVAVIGQLKFVEEITKADEEVLITGISTTLETDFMRPDGNLLHLSITKHRINLPNNEQGVLTIGNDITSKKKYEDIVNIQYTIDYLETLNKGLKSTIQNILDYIFRLYWIDAAGVYIYDPSAHRLNLMVHAGLSDDIVEQVKSYDKHSRQLKTVLKREILYIKTSDLPEESMIRNEQVGILMTAVIPLINSETNELVGNLNLASKKYEQISDEDKKGIESIARRIVNLILYAQSQEKFKESCLHLEQKVEEKTNELKIKIEEITRNEEKYRNLQDNIPIGVFTINFEGLLLHVNQRTVQMFGYNSIKEMLNMPAFDLYLNKEDRDHIKKTLSETGRLNEVEFRFVRKDKSEFWGTVSVRAVYDNDGKPKFFDGIVQDITDIKNAKIKLEEANKKITTINQNLEEKIREALASQEEQNSLLIQKSKLESLGELAAGIAHEINQPLGVMSLTFENLKSKINSNNFDSNYLEIKFQSIEENIKRIRDIIDHVRLFSREQDSFVLDKVNVNKVVQKALSLVGVQFSNHNINIILKLEEKIGFTVGSNLKLEQVVLNLLSNSKYALEEKAIYLGEPDFSKEIVIKTETTQNRIFLMIEDNGIGIKINHLPYIFDPFFTTKPEGVGTGLGLSIVYGLIKDMRGEILVNSREKEYTKFRISFPRFPEND